jgi:N-acetylglucosaminyldiphosphoundecaprenol N-acetyl-beta-D-mannosaminyltransferase
MVGPVVRCDEIMNVPITCFYSYDQAVEVILRRIRERTKTFCVAINPEKVCSMQRDPELERHIRQAHVHICDGIGTALAVRLITGRPIPRVTGVDLFLRLLAAAEREDLGVFLLGARPQTNRRACEVVGERYPRLRLAGSHDGYFADDAAMVREINQTQPDMLFAALGSPRQEKWLSTHLDAIDAPFCMGVGGSLDVLAGHARRAPELCRRTGTEFLYRLVREPKRWRRQLVLPGFGVRVFREALALWGVNSPAVKE